MEEARDFLTQMTIGSTLTQDARQSLTNALGNENDIVRYHWGMVGEYGAGKSSLGNMIAALDGQPNAFISGSIPIQGNQTTTQNYFSYDFTNSCLSLFDTRGFTEHEIHPFFAYDIHRVFRGYHPVGTPMEYAHYGFSRTGRGILNFVGLFDGRTFRQRRRDQLDAIMFVISLENRTLTPQQRSAYATKLGKMIQAVQKKLGYYLCHPAIVFTHGDTLNAENQYGQWLIDNFKIQPKFILSNQETEENYNTLRELSIFLQSQSDKCLKARYLDKVSR